MIETMASSYHAETGLTISVNLLGDTKTRYE